MSDILTVTLNPALDMSTSVATMRPGEKLRCVTPVYDPGGGGINVARAVRLLGGRARAFVAIGGYRGEQLCDLLVAEGVSVAPFQVMGETRVSLAVTDRTAARQFRFVMPGPEWDSGLADAALAAITAEVTDGYVVLSGSQPEGVPLDFTARLAARIRGRARLIVDLSGAALQALVADLANVDVLRLDRAESEALAGHALQSIEDIAGFAKALVRQGAARRVVLAMGEAGSVMASGDGAWHAVGPKVPVASKVGAGDSFVGAFALALSRGSAADQALAHGVAAASAAVMSDATELCRTADFQTLVPQVAAAALP